MNEMLTYQIIILIIVSITTIISTITAIFAIIRRKQYINTFKAIKNKIDEYFLEFKKHQEESIKESINHTEQIEKLLQDRDVAFRIREVIKYAIQYCGNIQLSKIIDYFCQQFIVFVQDITDIGFENITKQQIETKFLVTMENIDSFSLEIIKTKIYN